MRTPKITRRPPRFYRPVIIVTVLVTDEIEDIKRNAALGELLMRNEIESIQRLIVEGKVESAVKAIRELDNALLATEVVLHDRTSEVSHLRKKYQQVKDERDALAATCRDLLHRLGTELTSRQPPQLKESSGAAAAYRRAPMAP